MRDSRMIIEQSLAGKAPQRPPVFDLFANDAVIEHFGGAALDGTDDEVVVKAAAANGLDATRTLAAPHSTQTRFTDPAGNVRVNERWTSWLEKPAHDNVEGWVRWMKNYLDQTQNGLPRTACLDLTEPLCDPQKQEKTKHRQEEYASTLGGTVNIFCTPGTSLNALFYYLGLEMVSFLWIDHFDLLEQWIGLYQRETLNYIEVTGHEQASPLAIIYSDIAYKNGPLVSPDMLAQVGFWEEVEQFTAACHARGLKVIFHSDGNIMCLLDNLVATGIDGLNPIEKAAGMDAYEIRRRFPELTIVGGVDVTGLLRVGSPQEIRCETRRLIDELGAEGRLLIGSSTEVGDDVPLENYLAFHNEVVQP